MEKASSASQEWTMLADTPWKPMHAVSVEVVWSPKLHCSRLANIADHDTSLAFCFRYPRYKSQAFPEKQPCGAGR